jgi:hypothetical protein
MVLYIIQVKETMFSARDLMVNSQVWLLVLKFNPPHYMGDFFFYIRQVGVYPLRLIKNEPVSIPTSGITNITKIGIIIDLAKYYM